MFNRSCSVAVAANYEIAVLNWQKKFQNAATEKLVELKKSIINLLIE